MIISNSISLEEFYQGKEQGIYIQQYRSHRNHRLIQPAGNLLMYKDRPSAFVQLQTIYLESTDRLLLQSPYFCQIVFEHG